MDYIKLLFLGSLVDTWAVITNNPLPSIIAAALAVCLSLAFSALRGGMAAMKKNLKTVWKGAKGPLLALSLIFVLNLFVFTPKRIYEIQKAIADKVPQLTVELNDRTHNIHAEDPAYWNLAKTIKAFSILRRSNPNDKCEVKMTMPRGQRHSVADIVFFGADLAGCPPEAAGDSNADPEYERKAMENAVANAVVIHMAKDFKGGLAFYDAMSELFDVRRSYEPFSGSAPNVIWIQFGSDVQWNSQR